MYLIIIIIVIIIFMKDKVCFLFLDPQNKIGPSISSSVVLCFLCPFGLYCNACFGNMFVSILYTCCSHYSWYCFISFTIFCAPVFSLIHWGSKKTKIRTKEHNNRQNFNMCIRNLDTNKERWKTNIFERKLYRKILGPVCNNEKENLRILTNKEIYAAVKNPTMTEIISLTLRRLMSYIYGAPILDVSRSHTTTQHSR